MSDDDRQNLIRFSPRATFNQNASFRATSTLVFDLRSKALEPLAREAAAEIRRAMKVPKGSPKDATTKRRQGKFWNVSGHLRDGIKAVLIKGAWSVSVPSDRLEQGFLYRILGSAVPLIKDKAKLAKLMSGKASKAALKRIVKKVNR